jgi:hypothetical protein
MSKKNFDLMYTYLILIIALTNTIFQDAKNALSFFDLFEL